MIPQAILATLAVHAGTAFIERGVKNLLPEVAKLLDEPKIGKLAKDVRGDKIVAAGLEVIRSSKLKYGKRRKP